MRIGYVLRAATCAAFAIAAVSAASRVTCAASHEPGAAALAGRSVAQWEIELEAGRVSSAALTRAYLLRIERLNPLLRAVIALNPQALAQARLSDRRRRAGRPIGALEGIPFLVKDNIDVGDGLPTTAGSLALVRNLPSRPAPVIARLLAAGAVMLGKTNLSEWANIRSERSSSGWSAVGGLTRNPYALDRSACGSSSGSAVAVAADLAPLAIGTETDGSITCPASVNGVVGLKPTVGLVSRTGIIPISFSQDTAGPLARRVADAALLLNVLAGSDSADAATADADSHRRDYRPALQAVGLRGRRIGVVRFGKGYSPATLAVFDTALATLRARGATLVDLDVFDFGDMRAQESTILLTEFKSGLEDYLAGAPAAVGIRSLDDLLRFDRTHPRELAWFGQDLFEKAAASRGIDDPAYRDALREARQRARTDGIDRLLRTNDVIALVAPTTGPAWRVDRVKGDAGSGSFSRLPGVAGYPHLSVPMGTVAGLPVGLSFVGPAWSEALLIELGASYEQAAPARMPPRFARSVRPMD